MRENISENIIFEHLLRLGLARPLDLETEYYPTVRDRDDVAVFKANPSGAFFLSENKLKQNPTYYDRKEGFEYWNSDNYQAALLHCKEDDLRRARQFSSLIRGKRWADIGTGTGGIVHQLASEAAEVLVVEPQEGPRNALKKFCSRSITDFASIEEIPLRPSLEVVTLFHVFEHLPDPISSLKLLFQRMAPGGKLVIEVPHAKDFLLSFLNLECFKKFTFWSEHLILHTRETLSAFLKDAGFECLSIAGFQRYPLANHLFWCAKGLPGGHLEWSVLTGTDLDQSYSQLLASLDMTDTLIAQAIKPG